MTKSDTESDNTDLESPSTEDLTKDSQNATKKFRLPGTQGALHILFFGTLCGLLFLCLGIGLYSLKHLEDLRVAEDGSAEVPTATTGVDDDLAFELRPDLKIDVPTGTPTETLADNIPPQVIDIDGDSLLQGLRSIFGQEIAVKILSGNSPLSKAYDWITDQDEYAKTNPDAVTVQRFMLAAFYYSMGGRRARSTWKFCGAVPETTQEDEDRDTSLPIRCVFEDGESACAFIDEFLECPEYYKDWEVPPATPKNRWLSNSFECDWYGISCNDDGEVYQISLPNNGLVGGSLIPEITALEKLTHIHLDYNSIGGPIPSLNKMDIHELSLASNSFEGRLELSDQWPNLEQLVLGDGNNINISISPLFGRMYKLGTLDLSGNNIDSGLPDQAPYKWGVLTDLRLSYCNLGGSLPQGLIGLSSLESLDFHHNRLTGNLPSSLWNLQKLTSLRLDNNYFQGTLSSEIGNLTNLRELSIVDIGLTGALPSELSNLPLESVSLQHNVFSSPIPNGMCNIMPQLHTLEADCGWRGFPCTCCTTCCEALVLDPNKCYSQWVTDNP